MLKPSLFSISFFLRLWLILLVGATTVLTVVNAEEPTRKSNTQETKSSTSEQRIFALLKTEFSRKLLDDEFKTLQQLSEHPRYLNYLSETYDTGKPFKKFAQFPKNVLPPKERYFKYFQGHLNVKNVDEITDEDHAIFHHLSEELWKMDVQQLHGQEMTPEGMMPFLMKTMMNKDVQEWMVQRKIVTQENAGPQIGQFLLDLMVFNLDIVTKDIEDTKTLLETHGQNDGLIMLAIQKPLLFARILSSFRDADVFLTWTKRRKVQ